MAISFVKHYKERSQTQKMKIGEISQYIMTDFRLHFVSDFQRS